MSTAKRKPCKHCPFLIKIENVMSPARMYEVADALIRGGEFPCHKTLDYGENAEGESVIRTTDQTSFCVGAMAALDNYCGDPSDPGSGSMQNQMVRISSRFGMIRPDLTTGHEEVIELQDWLDFVDE